MRIVCRNCKTVHNVDFKITSCMHCGNPINREVVRKRRSKIKETLDTTFEDKSTETYEPDLV